MQLDYDLLAQEYARHRRVHPQVLKDLIRRGGLERNSRVLEVGCGTGNYVAALEKGVGCACWGIEPSEQMLAKAREQAIRANFKQGRAEELEHTAGFFDLVFSVDVIHHVKDHAEFFRRALRVLKPGGRLCTVTDSEEIIRRRQPLSTYFPATTEVDLRRYPCIMPLRKQMAQVGFRCLEEVSVELAYSLDDIQVYRDKAFSCLHLISASDLARGIRQMEQDRRTGPIPCVSRYLLLWGTKS